MSAPALYARLHEVANEAADYVSNECPTVRPSAPANDVGPASLLSELAASVRIVEEIERVECDQWFEGEPMPVCQCDAPCAREPHDEYLVLRERAYCSRECVALHLLWAYHITQDQSPATVRRVEQMIESSFAAARGGR